MKNLFSYLFLFILTIFLSNTSCANARNLEGVAPTVAAQQESRSSVLSPDGKLRAFVRSTPDILVETALSDSSEATEIWTSSPDGGDARLQLRGHFGPAPENTLANITNLQFSPDGRQLFFLSTAWVTSRAIHVLDLATGTEKYVCDGNSLEVIQRGEYAGHLMVMKHRYFIAGGSYDFIWLLTPEGKEVGPISDFDDDAAILRFKELYAE